MHNYDLPEVNHENTFVGTQFILPEITKYDLAGAKIKLQARKQEGTPVIHEMSTENGLIVIAEPYTFTLQPHVVKIKSGKYSYDIKIWFADGREKTYIGGYWSINTVITL